MFACDELRFGYEGFERLIDGIRGAGYNSPSLSPRRLQLAFFGCGLMSIFLQLPQWYWGTYLGGVTCLPRFCFN